MSEREDMKHDEFDLLLDEALRTFGEASNGLEERVLRGVATEKLRKRRMRITWVVALPLTACVLLALFLPRFVQHIPITVARIPVEPPALPVPPQKVDFPKSRSSEPKFGLLIRRDTLRLCT